MKQLIKIIITAMLSAIFGYQAGNPDSMARAYLLPEAHEETPQAYGMPEKGKTMAVADLLWQKTSTDTIRVGNFPPVVLHHTAYLSTAEVVEILKLRKKINQPL